MVLDLGTLREGPVAYLGWYLEGEAIGRGWPAYRCHASEDQGSNVFQVTVVAGSVAGDREARFRAAKDASFALAKGKVFLGTWQHQQDYNVNLPLAHNRLATQEIRDRILSGLFRLYENDFAADSFQVDLDGIASELGVSRLAVDRAVDWLYDGGLIKDHGTFGQHRGTGDFWLSSAGAEYAQETLPSALDTAGAAPMTSQRDATFARDPKRVAVVYGRDRRPREAMFSFLLALRLNPIEWTQAIAATGKGTPYNKEAVVELFKDTQAVVVLMTGDDHAQLREQLRLPSDEAFESELAPQPRPNVLIELGMALGIMDERTIIVEVGKLRPISDLLGLNVIRLSKDVATRKGLVERLKAAGCDLDDSGADWLTAGDFTPTPPKRANRRAKPADEQKVGLVEEEAAWSEERDRPRFEVALPSVGGLEAAFEPQFRVKQVSGDPVANLEWLIRGPRFSMDWRPASGSALARTHFVSTFDLTAEPREDDVVGVDEMAFEIRFHWRGQRRHELHRWPISRRQLPQKVLWDVGAERLPPLYFDVAG